MNYRFWAENDISLATVYSKLCDYAKLYPTQVYFKPSPLLESIVEGGSTVREEMYFRKNRNRYK